MAPTFECVCNDLSKCPGLIHFVGVIPVVLIQNMHLFKT